MPRAEWRSSRATPEFDRDRFAFHLRRAMEERGLIHAELARRAGLGRHSVGALLGYKTNTPRSGCNVRTLAGVAQALELNLGYVLSWAGLDDSGDRWENFSPRERARLTAALGGASGQDLDELLRAYPQPEETTVCQP